MFLIVPIRYSTQLFNNVDCYVNLLCWKILTVYLPVKTDQTCLYLNLGSQYLGSNLYLGSQYLAAASWNIHWVMTKHKIPIRPPVGVQYDHFTTSGADYMSPTRRASPTRRDPACYLKSILKNVFVYMRRGLTLLVGLRKKRLIQVKNSAFKFSFDQNM